jgi:tungstate transport system ATP-binding protein
VTLEAEPSTARLPALRVRGLRVEHRSRATLDVPDLAVETRETLSVVGPNGAGKSTLLRVLGLLEPPARGEVWFAGERVTWDPAQLLSLRRRMAIVFQDALLCRASVAKNVALGLKLRGVPAAERRRRVQPWLERFGIAGLADRYAGRISGGEAQRASLARAFVLRPEVLLLDEPFAALDPPTRQALLGDLQRLLAETHTSTLFVTHDRDEAFAVGDRVAVLLDGRVAQIGSPDEVARRPISEPVARFVGIEAVLPGRVTSDERNRAMVEVDGLRLVAAAGAAPGARVWACLRAEDVSLLVEGVAPPSEADNVLPGAVRSLTSWGTQVRVAVDCGAVISALATRRFAAESGLSAGKPVRVAFASRSVHLIARSEG